ncbi:MAG: hypothetical protein SF123_07545 [Chloroflexota bacterium]|nr:hypothetical protein [Chloroflexota bacterium]
MTEVLFALVMPIIMFLVAMMVFERFFMVVIGVLEFILAAVRNQR